MIRIFSYKFIYEYKLQNSTNDKIFYEYRILYEYKLQNKPHFTNAKN